MEPLQTRIVRAVWAFGDRRGEQAEREPMVGRAVARCDELRRGGLATDAAGLQALSEMVEAMLRQGGYPMVPEGAPAHEYEAENLRLRRELATETWYVREKLQQACDERNGEMVRTGRFRWALTHALGMPWHDPGAGPTYCPHDQEILAGIGILSSRSPEGDGNESMLFNHRGR